MKTEQIKLLAEQMISAQCEESGLSREEVLEVSTLCFLEQYIHDEITKDDLIAFSEYLQTPLDMEEVEKLKTKRRKQAEYRLKQKAEKLIERKLIALGKKQADKGYGLWLAVINSLHEDYENGKISQPLFDKAVALLNMNESEKRKIVHKRMSDTQIKKYVAKDINYHKERFGGSLEEAEEWAMIMISFRYECGYLYRDEFIKCAKCLNYELDIDAIDKAIRDSAPNEQFGVYFDIENKFRKIHKGGN